MRVKEEKRECLSVHVRIRPFTGNEPRESSIKNLDLKSNAMSGI
jgi:hypothetical protein